MSNMVINKLMSVWIHQFMNFKLSCSLSVFQYGIDPRKDVISSHKHAAWAVGVGLSCYPSTFYNKGKWHLISTTLLKIMFSLFVKHKTQEQSKIINWSNKYKTIYYKETALIVNLQDQFVCSKRCGNILNSVSRNPGIATSTGINFPSCPRLHSIGWGGATAKAVGITCSLEKVRSLIDRCETGVTGLTCHWQIKGPTVSPVHCSKWWTFAPEKLHDWAV